MNMERAELFENACKLLSIFGGRFSNLEYAYYEFGAIDEEECFERKSELIDECALQMFEIFGA